jgi:glycosyltransferase involved in cell wall biosynthesis
MTQPFFSVIIPVFNRAALIETAIRSVLAQTCQDFEIVVVDDGSKDHPEQVIAAIGDPRIRIFRQDNAGGGAARNHAIDKATGRFIAPLDSDDIFLPHHLAAMKTLLADSTDLVGYARIKVDRGQGREFLKPPRAIRSGEDMGEYLLCDRGFVPTITIAVARETAAKVRYHENLRAAEDTDFAIRLALAGCRFQMLEKPGAVWKDMADPNRTSAGGKARRMEAWLAHMRPHLTRRAWHGARGWAYAKMLARDGQKARGLALYGKALLAGAFPARLAGVIFLQVLLDAGQYRALANTAIDWLHMGMRERDIRAAARAVEQA